MYVIFPAEEVVELTLGFVTSPRPPLPQSLCAHHLQLRNQSLSSNQLEQHQAAPGGSPSEPKSKGKNKGKKKGKNNRAPQESREDMAAGGGDVTLRDLTHPSLNEALKVHNSVTFKLVRTVSDFTQQLSQVYEQHAAELQVLVANFRKKNAELRKERPACPSALFHTWETLLQEVEVDSQTHSDIASVLSRQVSRPLLERSFHRKIQSRKVFTHRESYETILTKTEEKLAKCRQDYKNAYLSYLSSPSTATLAAYLDAHNAYVTQLHATNGMLERYHQEALPQLLQVSDSVSVVRNAAAARDGEAREAHAGLLSRAERFLRTHDVLVDAFGARVTLSPRRIDQGELDIRLQFDGEEDGEAVEQGRKKLKKKLKKGKLKKFLVPVAIFLLLKAMTLIPLLLGVLGVKAWNALQLSFGSFVVSLALAVFQLCKKLAGDSHPPLAVAAPVVSGADMAYHAHRR